MADTATNKTQSMRKSYSKIQSRYNVDKEAVRVVKYQIPHNMDPGSR